MHVFFVSSLENTTENLLDHHGMVDRHLFFDFGHLENESLALAPWLTYDSYPQVKGAFVCLCYTQCMMPRARSTVLIFPTSWSKNQSFSKITEAMRAWNGWRAFQRTSVGRARRARSSSTVLYVVGVGEGASPYSRSEKTVFCVAGASEQQDCVSTSTNLLPVYMYAFLQQTLSKASHI